ncbi:MAG TPA: hypothetical protein VF054_00410 [Micromonosporaceae bacterium]
MTTIKRQDAPSVALLARAATLTGNAPSLVSTRAWRCRVERDVLRLYAEPQHRPVTLDPDRRAQTLSCGVALHHAYTAVRAAGHDAAVRRLPDPAQPDLIAEVRVGGRCEPERDVLRQYAVVARRAEAPVGQQSPSVRTLAELQTVAERYGAHLLLLRDDQRAALSAPDRTGTAAPATEPLGIPTDPRDVYALLYGDSDDRHGWLRGGEALSAVCLTAADDRLAAVPVGPPLGPSIATRTALFTLVGVRYPYLVLRLTEGTQAGPSSPVRRRDADVVGSGTDTPRSRTRRTP